MKRKASSAVSSSQDQEEDVRRAAPPPRLVMDDDFLVHEILPRLSVHAARPFAATSALFRGVLTDRDYWRARRPPPGPRAACLVVRGGRGARFLHEFHYADAASSPRAPAVARAAAGLLAAYRFAGACDGLVLLTAPWNNRSCARALVFNPASGAEETLDLPIDSGRHRSGVFHCFCGLGYSPSSHAYKALLCAYDAHRSSMPFVDVELTVASLGAGAGVRERRTVAEVRCCRMDGNDVPTSLSLDNKVYILVDMGSSETKVLAFDVDDETVTYIEPPPIGQRRSELMEVWGRPCVATGYGGTTLFWTLMPDHHVWELRGSVAGTVPGSSKVHGAWDCGNGLLFVVFGDGRGCMYDLQEAAAPAPQVGGAAPLPPELRNATFCWGYQPTLVRPPTAAFGGAACPDQLHGLGQFSNCPDRPRKSAAVGRRGCLELLMETIRTLRVATDKRGSRSKLPRLRTQVTKKR
ncbi:hypothetical protein BS78_05G098500 [Paspalum vaginatum]|nr:hypothetical protein BS78_05G098500 [Paspalum vaginatum]